MTKPQLSRQHLKIVFFSLDPEDENKQGCSVVHRPTNTGAVSDDPEFTTRKNLLYAIQQVAAKLGIPLDQVNSLFYCSNCNQERLPAREGWKAEHTYLFSKEETLVETENTLFCCVTRGSSGSAWEWTVSDTPFEEEGEGSWGEEIILEDAFDAAEKAASNWFKARKEGD